MALLLHPGPTSASDVTFILPCTAVHAHSYLLPLQAAHLDSAEQSVLSPTTPWGTFWSDVRNTSDSPVLSPENTWLSTYFLLVTLQLCN